MQALKEVFFILITMVCLPTYGLAWIVGFLSMFFRSAWIFGAEGFWDGHEAADNALMDACSEPQEEPK
mgnify:CR=1 FL=1